MVLLADGLSRNSDRRHAGRGARGRRNGAAALHGPVQQLLALVARPASNLMQPTASLAVLIYNFAGMPFQNQVELAWAAALVLVLMVLTANLIGQSLSRRQQS